MKTAWPAIRDTCNAIGWTFDRWQDGLGRLITALDGTGLYAADTSVISIPRGREDVPDRLYRLRARAAHAGADGHLDGAPDEDGEGNLRVDAGDV